MTMFSVFQVFYNMLFYTGTRNNVEVIYVDRSYLKEGSMNQLLPPFNTNV